MTLQEENGLVCEDDEVVEAARLLGYSMPAVPDEVSDIGEADGNNWRDFQDISTNSLWIIGSRSREGMHNGKYHGNFVPQIPFQVIRRFTKPEDVVLDPFLGSGTTLIECRRQGRHGIGIELIESRADDAQKRIDAESNPYGTWQEIIEGDSANEKIIRQVRKKLEEHGRSQVQLLIMHPPYHDIIKFSDHPRDLCNAPTLKHFLESFASIVRGTYDILQKNHFLVVVIGDKYGNREWVPLGFYTMEVVKSVGYTLKSIVVKNMEGNRAKRNLHNLWRQRAFKGKYYIFKHEYVLFFQKTEVVENLMRITEFVEALDDREERNLIKDSSFVSGEGLSDIIKDYTWITPSRLLALKHGRQIRAVVLDLTGVDITRNVGYELEDLTSQLPNRNKIVDVSVVVEPEKRAWLQEIQIPGISQVYSNDQESLEQLAHAIYVVRKATGSGQRAGRAAGVAFADSLNAALEKFFEPNTDYEWSPRRGIGFKFFKGDPSKPFGEVKEGTNNFKVGIETKWISGHENEKIPQIRDRYYKRGFDLVVVVGSNIDRWKSLIRERGNFADYYLFVGKGSERSLESIIQGQSLVKAVGDSNFEETELTLVKLLRSKKSGLETQYS
jgi:hypothetical protein